MPAIALRTTETRNGLRDRRRVLRVFRNERPDHSPEVISGAALKGLEDLDCGGT
jgi:hypothetical protein